MHPCRQLPSISRAFPRWEEEALPGGGSVLGGGMFSQGITVPPCTSTLGCAVVNRSSEGANAPLLGLGTCTRTEERHSTA